MSLEDDNKRFIKKELAKLKEQQIFYQNIPNTDLLFHQLGYQGEGYGFRNKRGHHIYFHKFNRTVDVAGGDYGDKNKMLTLCQIDAICKKIIELGWLEE